MARISRGNSHPPAKPPKSHELGINKKSKKGSKQVKVTKPNEYLDKKALSANGQDLSSRKISPQNLNTLTSLAKEKKWTALSDAIKLHGNTSYSMIEVMEAIVKKDIELPRHIATLITTQFGRLSAITKAAVMQENLSKEPHEELGVLVNYLGDYNRPDSAVGAVARQTIDDFITEYKLEEVDRDAAVQQMSETLYSIILLRVQMLRDLLIRQSVDKDIKEILEKAQNELRIELSHLHSIQPSS